MGALLWAIIGIVIVIAWGIGVVDIFRRHLDAKHTVAWLLVVLIMPILGTILYWVLRPEDEGALERKAAAQAELRHARHDRPFDNSGFGV